MNKKIFGILMCMLTTLSTVSVTAQQNETRNTVPIPTNVGMVNITIQDFFYTPDNITIAVDTIVTWTNLGPMAHTATSDTGVFNSGLLDVGQQFSFTFTEAGTYKYHCAPHPWMHGVVIVTGGGNLPPLKPDITGPSSGKPGVAQTYTAVTTDPENMTISYFFDWGDGTNSGWTMFVTSGTAVNATHTWNTKGSYTITVKAKDEHGGISPTATLPVKIPTFYNIPFTPLWERLLERFPHAFPIIRALMNL